MSTMSLLLLLSYLSLPFIVVLITSVITIHHHHEDPRLQEQPFSFGPRGDLTPIDVPDVGSGSWDAAGTMNTIPLGSFIVL